MVLVMEKICTYMEHTRIFNTALNFGPKNESESKAFETFSKEVADERYAQVSQEF